MWCGLLCNSGDFQYMLCNSPQLQIFSICCGVLCSCGELHIVWDDQYVIFCRYWNALCVQVTTFDLL